MPSNKEHLDSLGDVVLDEADNDFVMRVYLRSEVDDLAMKDHYVELSVKGKGKAKTVFPTPSILERVITTAISDFLSRNKENHKNCSTYTLITPFPLENWKTNLTVPTEEMALYIKP